MAAPKQARVIVADWLRTEQARIEKDLQADKQDLSPQQQQSRHELLAWIALSIEELED